MKYKFAICLREEQAKSKVDACGVCSLREKAKSVLCVKCGKGIHG